MQNKMLSLLGCPVCFQKMKLKKKCLICPGCQEKLRMTNEQIILALPDNLSDDTRISLDKWDNIYQQSLKKGFYNKEKRDYESKYLQDTISQISQDYSFKNGDIYLEIGCGPMYLGQYLGQRGLRLIGIDFSLSALKVADKMLKAQKVKDYLLIQGDIQQLPLVDQCVDLIYGGGVIEHFKDTRAIAVQMHRVLKKDGIAFNSVPQLNFGSLTYRQIWGNIPDFPVIKQLAEFVHIKLLGKKHMRFGYELSFTKGKLKRIFKKAGFTRVDLKKLKCELSFEYLPFQWLKDFAKMISKNDLFNPMLFIVARK